jgi:hypothetical protein
MNDILIAIEAEAKITRSLCDLPVWFNANSLRTSIGQPYSSHKKPLFF